MGFRVGTMEFYHPNHDGGRVGVEYNDPNHAGNEMGQDAASGAAWANEGDNTGMGKHGREDGIAQDARDSEDWDNGASQDGIIGVNGHFNGDIVNNAHYNDTMEAGGSTSDTMLGGENRFCSNINGGSVDGMGRFPSTDNGLNGEVEAMGRFCSRNGGRVDEVVLGRFSVDVNGLNGGGPGMESFSNNINGVNDTVEGMGRLYTKGSGSVEDIARFSVNVNGHNEAVEEMGAQFLGGTSGGTYTDGRTMNSEDHFSAEAGGRATKVEFNDWDSDRSDDQMDRTRDYVNILKQVVNI
uniref:Uncharacterized protein n=1 Tax=Cacopsylla melanoneura TaxID=428564 RepID=A0A8D9A6A5_9HEMI